MSSARTALQAQIAAAEARERADVMAAKWAEAHRLAAELEQRGREIDAMLAAAADAWHDYIKLFTGLLNVASVDMRDILGRSQLDTAFDRSCEAVGLPSKSAFRGVWGSAAVVPGTASLLAEGVRAYLASRQPQPEQIPAAA